MNYQPTQQHHRHYGPYPHAHINIHKETYQWIKYKNLREEVFIIEIILINKEKFLLIRKNHNYLLRILEGWFRRYPPAKSIIILSRMLMSLRKEVLLGILYLWITISIKCLIKSSLSTIDMEIARLILVNMTLRALSVI